MDLDESKRIIAAATEGPWEVAVEGGQLCDEYAIWMPEAGHDGAMVESLDDAAFITHARTALPELVAKVRELEAESQWHRSQTDHHIGRANRAEQRAGAAEATVEQVRKVLGALSILADSDSAGVAETASAALAWLDAALEPR